MVFVLLTNGIICHIGDLDGVTGGTFQVNTGA